MIDYPDFSLSGIGSVPADPDNRVSTVAESVEDAVSGTVLKLGYLNLRENQREVILSFAK